MEFVKVDADNAVDLAVNALDDTGIVMHPTETCYGFAVDVFNESALRKLCHVKNMPTNKPLSILVDSLEMAQEYGDFSEKALQLAKKYWPGPVSIVVPRKDALPEFFNKGYENVSIRFSSNEFSTNMVKQFAQPVVTTSANKSGKPQLYEAKRLPGVDLIVNGGKIDLNSPSAILQPVGDRVKILRKGDAISK